MAKIAWINPSPRYPKAAQLEKVKAWGATKIYVAGEDTGDVYAVIKSIRPGDEFGVVGLHQLADNMLNLTKAMKAVAKRGRPLRDLELEIDLPAKTSAAVAAYANAKRVYDAKSRGTPDEMAERGRKGGRKAAKEKRAPLTNAHRQVWFAARTNLEAAKKIAKMLGRPISVQTLRRRFKPSGRGAGWPSKVET